jgi:hypothetical protein
VVLAPEETAQTAERMVETVAPVFNLVLREPLDFMEAVEAVDGTRAMFPEQVAQAVEQMVPQATIQVLAITESMD